MRSMPKPCRATLTPVLESDASFEACERSAETEMNPKTESDVAFRNSGHVKARSVREPLLITVRRPEEHHHHLALRNRYASEFRIRERLSEDDLDGRVVTQRLFDETRNECVTVGHLRQLFGVLREGKKSIA